MDWMANIGIYRASVTPIGEKARFDDTDTQLWWVYIGAILSSECVESVLKVPILCILSIGALLSDC
jgi:hypothetical protein